MKGWNIEFTGLTVLALLIALPVGIVCVVRDNDWAVLAFSVIAIATDLRISRKTEQAKTGSGK